MEDLIKKRKEGVIKAWRWGDDTWAAALISEDTGVHITPDALHRWRKSSKPTKVDARNVIYFEKVQALRRIRGYQPRGQKL